MPPSSSPTRVRIAAMGLALFIGTGSSADAGAKGCQNRGAYEGPALHAPVEWPVFAAVPDEQLSLQKSSRLDGAFERAASYSHAVSISAAVAIPGEGVWQHTIAPVDGPRLYWASAGKTFTAVAIFQLAEEGKLSLDDPVSRWVKGVPGGDIATIGDLLAHTSGLFSSNEDAEARANPQYRSPGEQLEIARKHGLLFCAGQNWRYSNTGYALLGEIIRKADGRPFDEAITARIIRPLRLKSMIALKPGKGGQGVAPLISQKERPIDPSWPGAAGPIASDASDMVRFWEALLSGKLLPLARARTMFDALYPMFDSGTYYGLGAMVFDVPDGTDRLFWLGHAGGTPGASAVVAYSPRDNAIVAVAVTGDGQAGPVANLLLKTLR